MLGRSPLSAAPLGADPVVTGDVSVTNSNIVSTVVLYALTIAYALTGGTVASGASTFAPTLAHQIEGVTITPTTVVNAPTFSYEITSGTIASTFVAYSAIISDGTQAVTNGFVSSGSVLFPLESSYEINVPFISSGLVLSPATTTYLVSVANIPTTSVLFSPEAIPGAVTVFGESVNSSVLIFPPTAAYSVLTASIPTTSVLFSPDTSYEVVGQNIGPSSVLFAPTVIYSTSGATIASGSLLFSPSATYLVDSPTIASGSLLFSPSATYLVDSPTIASGSTLNSPSVNYEVSVSTIVSGFTLNSPSINYEVSGPTIASGLVLYSSDLSYIIVGSTILSGSTVHQPQTTYLVTSATIASESLLHIPGVSITGGLSTNYIDSNVIVFSPAVSYGVAGSTIVTGSVLFPATVSYSLSQGLISSTTILFPPIASYNLIGSHVPTTLVLNAPSLDYVSGGATIASTSILYELEVVPGPVDVFASHISGSLLFPPFVSYSSTGSFISAESSVFQPTIAYSINASNIVSTVVFFGPDVLLTVTPDVQLIKPAVRKPFLLPPRDRSIQARQSKDLFKLAVSSVTYFIKEEADKEPEDLMYLESPTQELVLGKRYSSRAFVKKVPTKATLKKFGLEEARDIQVEFRKEDLVRKSLPKPVIGSYFIVEKELYKVTEASDKAYIDHYNNSLQYVVLGMKIKNSSFKDFFFEEDEKLKTLFFSSQDRHTTANQSKDLFKASVSSLTYFVKEDSDKEPEDIIYMESPEQELVLGKPYRARAFVRIVPLTATSNKFGLEEKRNLQIEFLKDDLENKALPVVGSHIVVEKEFYRVLNTFNAGYVDHYDNHIQYVTICTKVSGAAFKDFVIEEEEKLNSLFFGKQDVGYLSGAHSFLFKKVFAKHVFIERIYDNNIDLLYLENLDKNNLPGTRFELPVFVLTNPSKKKLKKFGIQEERDLQIELSYSLSREYLKKVDAEVGHHDGLPDIGTIMIFRDEPYIILDSTPQYYFGNTSIQIGKLLFAKKMLNSIFREGPSTLTEIEPITEAGSVDPYSDDNG